MRELMSSNVFEGDEEMIVCASCLPYFDKNAFEKVKKLNGKIFFVCLESFHMNMVAHKLSGFVETGKVKKIVFVSIDKSPHCIQLQYIRKEIEKQLKLFDVVYESYVVSKGDIIKVSLDTISLSKNLSELSKIKD
jgi:hypothetical protein